MATRRGQALVEFVLVFPIIIGLITFMIDIDDQVRTSMIVVSATREGARLGAHMSSEYGEEILKASAWRACNFLAANGLECGGEGYYSDGKYIISGDVATVQASGGDAFSPLIVAVEYNRHFVIGFLVINNNFLVHRHHTAIGLGF